MIFIANDILNQNIASTKKAMLYIDFPMSYTFAKSVIGASFFEVFKVTTSSSSI